MIVITLYPDQNENLLKEFLGNLNSKFLLLSYKKLDWINCPIFYPGEMPPQDDSLRVFFKFLQEGVKEPDNKDEFCFVDWTNVNFSVDKDKLKKSQKGFFIVEENIKVENFRLAPYMENLLKICSDINLPGTDRLYKTNPKLLLPKILKGTKDQLSLGLERFLQVRSTIHSSKFIGSIPIFNSEFFICD